LPFYQNLNVEDFRFEKNVLNKATAEIFFRKAIERAYAAFEHMRIIQEIKEDPSICRITDLTINYQYADIKKLDDVSYAVIMLANNLVKRSFNPSTILFLIDRSTFLLNKIVYKDDLVVRVNLITVLNKYFTNLRFKDIYFHTWLSINQYYEKD